MEDVVITGMGVVSALGDELHDYWQALMTGQQGYKKDGSPDQVFSLTGHIPSFAITDYGFGQEEEELDRAAQLGLAAATRAMDHAGLLMDSDHSPVPVIMGTTCGANHSIETEGFDQAWFSEDNLAIDKHILENYDHSTIATTISKEFGLTGPASIIGTACAASNHALGEAADLIRLGRAEVVICGGAESLSLLPIYGFHSIKGLAKDECKPFAHDRQGYVIGEGAGVMILESARHAKSRKAKILAQVDHWSLNCDASSFALSLVDGRRCKELIEDCLSGGGLGPEDIDYINLHGTGSKTNDLMEVNGIKEAFGAHSVTIPTSSIKAMTGHTLGAAGVLDNIATVLSIQHNSIPPIINLEQAEEGFDLNFITQANHKQQVDRALSLSFAFGGCNVATLFSRYKEEQ